MSSNLTISISFRHNARYPARKADASIRFNQGVLEGLVLKGFTIWDNGNGLGVSLPKGMWETPSRSTYKVSFLVGKTDRIERAILDVYRLEMQKASPLGMASQQSSRF